jgi:hypothetical protein
MEDGIPIPVNMVIVDNQIQKLHIYKGPPESQVITYDRDWSSLMWTIVMRTLTLTRLAIEIDF